MSSDQIVDWQFAQNFLFHSALLDVITKQHNTLSADSLKNPHFVLNLGWFEVIAVYAAAWDPTLWVTLKTLALFQILSYLVYVNSYYALRPLLIQDCEEWGLQFSFQLVPEIYVAFVSLVW